MNLIYYNTQQFSNIMIRRQSFPETSRLPSSSLQQIKDLKLQIQLKNHQIEDLKFELNTFRKKQSIWHHLGETYEKANIQQERKHINQQNQKLKSQIVSMLTQLQQKNAVILQQKQKINDLKQYNKQLKKLNEKSQQIHKKQIDMIKAGMDSLNQVNQLKRQKQKLQIAISKCDAIGKQMEDFYMNQIQILKKQIDEQKHVIVRLENNKNAIQNQLNKRQEELKQMRVKITETQSKLRQNDFSQLLKRQNSQKKWEIILSQVKQRYEKEIGLLKEQIRLLMLKIDGPQDDKTYYEGLTTSVLTQSKLGMSSASNQSFRFTPNNSFSSSIKESLSRRQLGTVRTPSKSSRNNKNSLGYLLDRTNL